MYAMGQAAPGSVGAKLMPRVKREVLCEPVVASRWWSQEPVVEPVVGLEPTT